MEKKTPTPNHAESRSPLISAGTVARHFAVSQALVYRLARRRVIPSYRVGHALRFQLDELTEAFSDKR